MVTLLLLKAKTLSVSTRPLTSYVAVVLLRGCWLDGTNKCLKNGAAEVCTCSTDLCNLSSRTRAASPALLLAIATAVFTSRHWAATAL